MQELWQEGKLQQQHLEDLSRINAEALALQITSNEYTPHSVASLAAESTSLNAWIHSFLQELEEEKVLKAEYLDKAAKVNVTWLFILICTVCKLDIVNHRISARQNHEQHFSWSSDPAKAICCIQSW